MFVKEEPTFEAAFTAAQMRATGVHPKIEMQELRSDITVLYGSGAHISVFNDPDGLIMIDSGFGVSQPEIENALSSISSKGVRFLINSHFHFDHTDGNAWVRSSGAEIIAESHTRLRMSRPQPIPAFRTIQSPAPLVALPTISFHHLMHIGLRNENILLKRYPSAHTDSDVAIYFENHDVLHVADTWFHDIYPFVDSDGGGSIDGLIEASKENLALAGPKTLVIPGHGRVGTRDDLVDFYDMLVEVRARVAHLKEAGHPLSVILDHQPTARFDARYGHGFIPRELFVSQVYEGI